MIKLMHKKGKKGFTLAELLIVVAIIAILVAIAIPAFGAALDKAKLAKDAANIRAAYAEAVVAYMDSNVDPAPTTTVTGLRTAAGITDAKTVTTLIDSGKKIEVKRGDLTPIIFGVDTNVVTG